MSAPSKPSVVPGVIAALLTLAIQPFIVMALVLQAGGPEELRLGVERAGMATYLILGCAALGLCAVLSLLASGRRIPLVAPVGLAVVP